jgi:hypothetical protein
MKEDSTDPPPPRVIYKWGREIVPHGITNTPEEWTRYIEARRRPDALLEVERLRKGRRQKMKGDDVSEVIVWTGVIEIGRVEGEQSQLYDEALERIGKAVTRWVREPDLNAIRRFLSRLEKESEPEIDESTPSDKAKRKALELVDTYLREDKRLITQGRLIEVVKARMGMFGIQISFAHRHLKEIGLDGLPREKRGPKQKG